MMEGIFLLLGSNLGNKKQFLAQARDAIEKKAGTIIKSSAIHISSAWGHTQQPDFLNQVIEVRTSLNPFELLDKLQNIEIQLGRVRFEKWGPRIIDIDILYFGNHIIESEKLIIPHPEIPYRRFTLEPLKEIAPDFVHPVISKTNAELVEMCNDPNEVETLKA